MKTKQLVHAALFVALIAIGALVKLPLGPVPFTLQLPMVILTGLLLGPKLAFISLITYTLLGLLGIPIFAGASGLGAFVSPTFGFIIGYIPAALIIGVGKNKSIAKMVMRSEEHTSELQSRFDLVCRLLLEKKNQHRIALLHH